MFTSTTLTAQSSAFWVEVNVLGDLQAILLVSKWIKALVCSSLLFGWDVVLCSGELANLRRSHFWGRGPLHDRGLSFEDRIRSIVFLHGFGNKRVLDDSLARAKKTRDSASLLTL